MLISSETDRAVIRLLVADDHPLIRAGLKVVLENDPGLLVVGEAENGEQAIEAFRRLAPDITLMDLRMPKKNGLDAIQSIRSTYKSARIVVLTSYDDEEDIYRTLEAGASGYLLKDSQPAELIASIRKVHDGGTVLSPAVAERLAQRVASKELSRREIEILGLVAVGNANKKIAEALGITPGTVKVHVANILDKLRSASRSEAVAVALRRGIIHLS